MELTETLMERVDNHLQAGREPVLATTPMTTAVGELVRRTEALEKALRELTVEVLRLSNGG